jgi:predicted DCC family thiol-disulfide oxidoreductase YuxK
MNIKKTLVKSYSEARSALRLDQVLTNPGGWSANLAIFRIVYLGYAVLPADLWLLHWTESILPGLRRGLWVPVSFYRLLPFGLLSNVALARTLALANIFLVALGLIGVCTRSAIGLATLLSLYLLGLAENQGMVTHYHSIVWFMALLAVGPSGQLFSIDSLRRTIKSADRGIVELSFPPLDALWTLRYVWILMGLIYLGPGLAKAENAITAGWAGATNLQNILWRKWLEMSLYDPSFVMPIRIDRLPESLLCLAGAGVIAFEIGFLPVVLFRRLRPFMAVWGLAFHIGNSLFLSIFFRSVIPAYVCLFDWTAIGRRFWCRDRGQLLVFYDGGSRMCRRTVAILRSIDMFDTLELIEMLSDVPRKSLDSQISREMLASDLYVADGGRVEAGYDAYLRIAKRIIVLWPAALLMRLPLVAALGRKLYRRVSDSRRCTLALSNLRPNPVQTPALPLVHRVGGLLVGCQLIISSTMLLYSLREVYLPTTARWLAPARWLVDGIGWRAPTWPFDLYPTFTPVTPSEVDVWEGRWVTSQGSELKISPSAYDGVYQSSNLTWNVLTSAAHDPNPAHSQTRSLDLVRALWRAEAENVRESVTAVNIYSARYRLKPSDDAPGVLLKETLIDTFPVETISENGGDGEHKYNPSLSVAPQAVRLGRTVVAFGDQSINAYSVPAVIKLTNTGSRTLTISSITVSSGFTILHWTSPNSDCTSIESVAAGDACQITVAFEPKALTAYSGAITIFDNASRSPQTVALSGNGTAYATPGLSTNWIVLNRGGGDSNNQCYVPSNATVNYALFLHTYLQTATCTSFDGPIPTTQYSYTSTGVGMRTFNFLYGTVEWRGKFGGGANSGLWGIVWMLDASCQPSDPTGTDNNCEGQEIDLTEILHSDFTHVNQQIHVNNGAHNDGCTAAVSDASQNYHTYDLVWSAGSLVWKVDGAATCTITQRYIPNAPMYVKLNNMVGSFGGTINNSTLPWSTEISYISITQNGRKIFYDDFTPGQF